jgi:tetratricopeptide (TPR) repeat protein
MGTYEDQRLVDEISAIKAELDNANEQARVRGEFSEQSFLAVRADIKHVGDNLLAIDDSLAQIASSLDSQLPLILRQLSRSGDLLESLIDAVANPTATSANELHRRGLLALKNGWSDEAITEFKRSIDAYPYDPSVHFALGCALAESQEYGQAAEAFAKAARYASPKHHSLAASAAILAARLYDRVGEPKRALEVLVNCRDMIPPAPDVTYEIARRTGTREDLIRALALKPALVVRARADGLQQLDAAASEVIYHSPGFTQIQADASRVTDGLIALLGQERRPSLERVLPLAQTPSASSGLALFAGQLPLTRERLATAIGEARARIAKSSAGAQAAVENARRARAGLAEPSRPAEPRLANNQIAKLTVYGILAIVLAGLVAAFQSHMAHIYNTQNHSPGTLKDGLTGILAWGGLLVFVGLFIATISSARKKAQNNAKTRTQHKAQMKNYRNSMAAYETQRASAGQLQSAADRATASFDTFLPQMNSAIQAAEEVSQRLEWTTVEPISIHPAVIVKKPIGAG